MNIPAVSAAALWALSLTCPAQEANPFVKKQAMTKAAETPLGSSFVGILEHILVPPAKINEWLRKNGLPADATALRAEVQTWVKQGDATLDCTAVTTGVTGKRCVDEWILEQTYPTEYQSNGPGVWPIPTGFEIRNLGYTTEFPSKNVIDVNGRLRFSVDAAYHEILGSTAWNLLAERTRQPGDMFFPIVRSYRLTNKSPNTMNDDPFADPHIAQNGDTSDFLPTIESGRVCLMAKFDPLPREREQGLQSRLVFARGEIDKKINAASSLPEDYGVSISAIRVPHLEFSTWLQEQPLVEVPHTAWQFMQTLRATGMTKTIHAANARAKRSKHITIQNIKELIYPTEYQPVNRTIRLQQWESSESRQMDGKSVDGVTTYSESKIEAVPGLAGASLATSFETRNTGMTYNIRILPGGNEVIAEQTFETVTHVGDSVHRRIDDQGNWIPDIQMPLFATSRCSTTTRLIPGQWSLIASGVEYNSAGKVDREHNLLMFVKVE